MQARASACPRAAAARPSRWAAPTPRSVMARSTAWGEQKQQVAEKAMWGEDFGARDATPGEIESNFAEKILSHWDTHHIIKIPAGVKKFVGIGAQAVKPASELSLVEGKDMDLLKNQVPGWRVVDAADGYQALRQEWKAKDDASAPELAARLQSVQVEGTAEHLPLDVQVEGTSVTVWLATPSCKGLTENDFIIASRMNDADVRDVQAKKKARYWA